MGSVEILLWWLPPVIVTSIAMAWVSWQGRARDVRPDRSEAAQERFAAAIMRELPSAVTSRVSAPRPVRERSTGLAVRPSQRSVPVHDRQHPTPDRQSGDDSRRSA